ncbi:15406_t:CDS:2 [Dentiscutata erythropus]|uniref:15406_t:CDS:1 n=1 Tax=Dentiscutata erythropus TaxID=1348616 RepID=A0A9N9F2B9_9GLOM|nr:15406_t:CDS:2 [Dentiscutata erythropus]
MFKVHKYFKHKYSDWNIVGFLNNCDLEPFQRKIDAYIKSLEKINMEKGGRQRKARLLFGRYRKAHFSPSHKTSIRAQVTFSVTCRSRLLADLTLDSLELGDRFGYLVLNWIKIEGSINGIINSGNVGTINEQQDSPLRRSPRIKKVSCNKKPNRANNASERTHEEISDENSEEYNDDEIDEDNDDEID